jgi:phosphatidylglycerophosphate synthase
VNLVWAVLIILAVCAVSVTAMLLVRRGAPAGSRFTNGDRAAGVFGVLSTGFAILLGFVIFLAFESYDTSRSGAESEAEIAMQQFETAQFLPARVRAQLSGELICYGRAVVHQEWPEMRSGTLGSAFNPWGVSMFKTIQTVEPQSNAEQTAFDKWFDQRSDRENARQDRVHGAEGVIPLPLWIVLLLTAGIIFVFMLFFADSEEGAIVQATMMGGIAIVVTAMLLLLWFLDNPYQSSVGGLKPTAMERTLRLMDQGAHAIGFTPAKLCDENGVAS